MKYYWPCAVRVTDEGKEEPISTYDAAYNLGEARQQIETWKSWYQFNVQKAWIDVYENGTKIETININLKDGSIMEAQNDPICDT